MLAYYTSERDQVMGHGRTNRQMPSNWSNPKQRYVMDRAQYLVRQWVQEAPPTEEAFAVRISHAAPFLYANASELIGTAQPLIEMFIPFIEPAIRTDILAPADMLANVRHTFNLSMSDAAEILHVTRPTLYRWTALKNLDGMEEIRPQLRERFIKLHRIANAWNKKGRISGRWLNVPLPGDTSMINLLRTDELNNEAIEKAHSTLFERREEFRQDEHQRSKNTAHALKTAFSALDAQTHSIKR